MRKIFAFISSCILLFALNSCVSKNESKPIAQGVAGDIIVVMSDELWNGEAGDTMRAIFNDYCRGLAYEENIMDLHQIPYEQFVDNNLLQKNIIFFEVNKNTEEPNITIEKERYATNQIFVNVRASKGCDFAKVVNSKRNQIKKLFLDADRERWITMFHKNLNIAASQKIEEVFNVKIDLPAVYQLDEILDEEFAWISYETRKTQNGILIYEYPITDSTELSAEYIIAKRNEILKERIPGGREGSYMTTETRYEEYYPTFEITTHNGVKTAIMHGLWRMQGDFMGGPYVSYTKLDEARNRVVCVEGFVYEPNAPVRDKIRLLEGIIYTYSIK